MIDGSMGRRRFLGRLAMLAVSLAVGAAGSVLPAKERTPAVTETPAGRTSRHRASHFRELAG
jgi:hypothetical protein